MNLDLFSKDFDFMFDKSILYKKLLKYYKENLLLLLKNKIDLIKNQINTIQNEEYKETLLSYIKDEENKIIKIKKKTDLNKINKNFKEEDLKYYIQTIYMVIDNKEVLRDENGLLYEITNDNTIIGKLNEIIDENENIEYNIEWFM